MLAASVCQFLSVGGLDIKKFLVYPNPTDQPKERTEDDVLREMGGGD